MRHGSANLRRTGQLIAVVGSENYLSLLFLVVIMGRRAPSPFYYAIAERALFYFLAREKGRLGSKESFHI